MQQNRIVLATIAGLLVVLVIGGVILSLIHISEHTRQAESRMPSSA